MKPMIWIAILSLGIFFDQASAFDSPTPRPMPPIYQVPVPEQLRPLATFALENFEQRENQRNKSLFISYDLPQLLVGDPNVKIRFYGNKGRDNVYRLQGDNGFANCVETPTHEYVCQVQYQNLVINRGAVWNRIQQVSRSDREAALRSRVSLAFEKEPVGIVVYR